MEVRGSVELRVLAGRKVGGHAAVFNQESQDLGGFVEIVLPGAFSKSLASGRDVHALLSHKDELILGRVSAGTLALSEDSRGLAFEIDLPETTAGDDVLTSVTRGDLRGASFAFKTPPGGDRWTQKNGMTVRELQTVELHEISLVSNPAYMNTDVARRAMADLAVCPRLANARRWLETV